MKINQSKTKTIETSNPLRAITVPMAVPKDPLPSTVTLRRRDGASVRDGLANLGHLEQLCPCAITQYRTVPAPPRTFVSYWAPKELLNTSSYSRHTQDVQGTRANVGQGQEASVAEQERRSRQARQQGRRRHAGQLGIGIPVTALPAQRPTLRNPRSGIDACAFISSRQSLRNWTRI